MRLRHIRGAEEAIETSPFVIQKPKEHRGHFCELFGNTNPIQIEVGMGKGKFIMELAQKYPETNFIGIERYSSVLLRALQKREELEISNIYFMCVDAKELGEIFAPGEVEKIYLNFSDPWPKDRHAKLRLTSPGFHEGVCTRYWRRTDAWNLRRIIRICLLTLWRQFRRQAGTLKRLPVICTTADMAEGNVMTEYETKFSAMGNPICKLIASR